MKRLLLPLLALLPDATTTVAATGPSTSVGTHFATMPCGSVVFATPGRVAPSTWSCVFPAVV
jgi:hypothetical protein